MEVADQFAEWAGTVIDAYQQHLNAGMTPDTARKVVLLILKDAVNRIIPKDIPKAFANGASKKRIEG